MLLIRYYGVHFKFLETLFFGAMTNCDELQNILQVFEKQNLPIIIRLETVRRYLLHRSFSEDRLSMS